MLYGSSPRSESTKKKKLAQRAKQYASILLNASEDCCCQRGYTVHLLNDNDFNRSHPGRG